MPDRDPLRLREGAMFEGRYRVVRFLGEGGMGEVYEVVHLETRRRRALKRMLPAKAEDPDLRARFELEKTIRADIHSEHVVDTIDAGDDHDGLPFVVMELLEGEDLSTMLRRHEKLPAAQVVTLLRQAALALDRTHAAGIVHRDLKPENLFVTRRDDGSPHLKVLDFGIAKLVARTAEEKHTTKAVGTDVYMAPEQMRGAGDIGAAADMYALGHVAYTLLTGKPYWKAERDASLNLIALHAKVEAGAKESARARAAEAGVDLPEGFDTWFEKATAPLPVARFQSASELVRALARTFGVPFSADGLSPPAEPTPHIAPGRRRITVAMLVAVALVAAGVAMRRSFFPPGAPRKVPSAEPSGSGVAPVVAIAADSAAPAPMTASASPAPNPSARAPGSPGTAAPWDMPVPPGQVPQVTKATVSVPAKGAPTSNAPPLDDPSDFRPSKRQ